MASIDLTQNKTELKVLLSPPMARQFERRVTGTNMADPGLGYVARACEQARANTTLLSWNTNLNHEAFRRRLLELRPDIVGIKVFTTMFRDCYETLLCVRETLPDAITLIGGPHPSASRPEDLFVEFDGLLDFAIAGDGERGIAALVKQVHIAGGKPPPAMLSDIPGLVYKVGERVQRNEPCLDAELDDLAPMDWSLQQPAWFGSSHGVDHTSIGTLIMDSRGCPGQCSFCMCSRINGSKARHRRLKLLRDEIDQLVRKYGVRVLVFTGNALLSDVEYLHELCEWLIAFNAPLKWTCTGAAYNYNLRNAELLSLMRRAGCTLIHFGIESGNPDVRKRIGKPESLEECTEVVNLAVKSGIRPACYFMFGFPDETVREMDDTIHYAFSLPYYSVSFDICLPLPGTSSYHAVCKREGIERIDWATYDFASPKLLPCKASIRQVHHKHFEARLLRKVFAKSRFARSVYRLVHSRE